MSSFQQLKSSRDKRHTTAKQFARDVNQRNGGATSDQAIHKYVVKAEQTSVAAEVSTSVGRHDVPAGLEVKTILGRGRGLFATKIYRPGEVVTVSEPLQAVPSSSNLSSICSACLLTAREIQIKTGRSAQLDACTQCRVIHYCSPTCKLTDARGHQDECEILQAIHAQGSSTSRPPEIPSEAVRALGRICLARKRGRQEKGKDPEWASLILYIHWSSVQAMEHHLDRLSGTGGYDQITGLARQLGRYLAHSAPAGTSREDLFGSFGFESTGELLQVCSAFQVNSFTLSLPDVSPIGVAISPETALANHSCEPNAVVVFPDGGRRMTVVAIRDIQPGEEILTSYIDVSLPLERRQEELSATYRFKCDCPLCRRDTLIRGPDFDGKDVDTRAAVWHQRCKGKRKGKASLPIGWSESKGSKSLLCDRCADSFSVDLEQLRVPHYQALSILESDAKGQDPTDQAVFMLIPTLHNLIPPSSNPLLPLLRLQLLRVRPSVPAELSHLDTLYGIVVAASTVVYPTHHPVLAILHAEWGQVLTQSFDGEPQGSVAGRLVKSVEILRKAHELCGKAFGPGGGLEGKKVAEVLRGVEGELHLARTMGK